MKININNKTIYKSILYLIFSGFLAISSQDVQASSITPMNVVELVNQARAEKGLPPLKQNEKLSKIAAGKAEDMIQNDYFAHNSPQGTTPWAWFHKYGYDYRYAGENLAISFLKAEDQQRAWMASEKHRKNILDPNYSEIGVAVKQGMINGKITTIAVQEFGQQAAPMQIKNLPQVATEKMVKNTTVGSVETQANRSLMQKLGLQLTALAVGIKNINLVSYFQASTLTLAWLDVFALSLIMFAWVAVRIARKPLEQNFIKLETISQQDFTEFMRNSQLDQYKIKVIYLEQMKLRI